jgi:RNA polymerase sigma-70 factor (ECF subfamily)
MQDALEEFERLRPRLHAIGYRMLASVQEAEDLVQDAWLRWHESSKSQQKIANVEAWLVTMTTRMAIDRLRAARVRREAYVGHWLPEPLMHEAPATPEQITELADDVSSAFLVLMDRLTPDARAAFLLREVFDADYAQVAEALGKSEAAARQIVHRAKGELEQARLSSRPARPIAVSHAKQRQVLRSFSQAIAHGDLAALRVLLADSAELLSDGGGVVPSFGKPLRGAQRIAQFYYASHRHYGSDMRMEFAYLNGQWALLRFISGTLESAQAVETDGERILSIHVQRNPQKLARLAARFQ